MIYSITKLVLMPVFKLLYRFSVRGGERVAAEGPLLIVANHTSYLDPVLMGLALRRPISFMAKEELFKVPVFGWYIKRLRAFPVKRHAADRRAIKMAIGRLSGGEVVGVFPEGARVRDGASGGFPGAAMLAYKSGAPVVPAAISGAGRVFPDGVRLPRFPRITVTFGEPFRVEAGEAKKETLAIATERIMSDIKSLLSEAGG